MKNKMINDIDRVCGIIPPKENFTIWLNKPTKFQRNIYRYGYVTGSRLMWLEYTWHFRYRIANKRWHPYSKGFDKKIADIILWLPEKFNKKSIKTVDKKNLKNKILETAKEIYNETNS